jgi:hypothetical protein
MEYEEPSPEPVPELDEPLRAFAESGYVPSGADVAGNHPSGHGHHGDHGGGVRRFEYRGHEVEIATHYEVTIDGNRWEGDLAVLDDGTVTYHGLPQYAVPSAVDLLRAVIDTTYEAPEAVLDAIRVAREEE